MYACRVTHEPHRLLLRPTFETLTGFWLLLAVPVSSLLIGGYIWIKLDLAGEMILPPYAIPVFLSLAVLAVICLVVSVGGTCMPLVVDREKGLKLGGNWLPTEAVTSLRVEGDPEEEYDEHFRLWVHLRDGDRLELKRSLWMLESDHDRICAIGNELANFLHVPFIDASNRFLPTEAIFRQRRWE